LNHVGAKNIGVCINKQRLCHGSFSFLGDIQTIHPTCPNLTLMPVHPSLQDMSPSAQTTPLESTEDVADPTHTQNTVTCTFAYRAPSSAIDHLHAEKVNRLRTDDDQLRSSL
jgi:hypothetical protein